jgi:predicted secreted Zn-dependent protease
MTGIDLDGLMWRKSSRSTDGECVETAVLSDQRVAVRDSKHPDDAVPIYTRAEWSAFIAGAKAGEFDLA